MTAIRCDFTGDAGEFEIDMKILPRAIAPLMIWMAAGPGASASTIIGDIWFKTNATFDNPDLLLATSIHSWSNPTWIVKATEDFKDLLGPQATLRPIALDYFGEPELLWSAGDFAFYITRSGIDSASGSSISASGEGFVTGPAGFEDTVASWGFSYSAGGAGKFSIIASTKSTGVAVPDGGTTLALLSLSVLGVCGFRRMLGETSAAAAVR